MAPVRRRRLPVVRLPQTRTECRGPGLCPKVGCFWNITLDVADSGSIRLNGDVAEGVRGTLQRGARGDFVDRASSRRLTDAELAAFDDLVLRRLDELEVNCALDIAEAGGVSLAEIGRQLGYTRSRVQQIEAGILDKAKRSRAFRELLQRLHGDGSD